MASLGECFCFSLPEESAEDEATIASLLLAFVRSAEGADGMALLASRAPHVPRRIYLFPGSRPLVREVADGLLRKYGGSACQPPAADETLFLVGSTTVWKQLPRAKTATALTGRPGN